MGRDSFFQILTISKITHIPCRKKSRLGFFGVFFPSGYGGAIMTQANFFKSSQAVSERCFALPVPFENAPCHGDKCGLPPARRFFFFIFTLSPITVLPPFSSSHVPPLPLPAPSAKHPSRQSPTLPNRSSLPQIHHLLRRFRAFSLHPTNPISAPSFHNGKLNRNGVLQ